MTWTRGCVCASSSRISPVPSGELSSRKAMSASNGSFNSASHIRRTLSRSLYVGMKSKVFIELHSSADNGLDHLFERDRWLPPDSAPNLTRVADEGRKGAPKQAGIFLDVVLPIESDGREGNSSKIADRVRHPGRDDVVVAFRLRANAEHRIAVVRGKAPIDDHVEPARAQRGAGVARSGIASPPRPLSNALRDEVLPPTR